MEITGERERKRGRRFKDDENVDGGPSSNLQFFFFIKRKKN